MEKNPFNSPEFDRIRKQFGRFFDRDQEANFMRILRNGSNKGIDLQVFYRYMGTSIVADELFCWDLQRRPWQNNPLLQHLQRCVEECDTPRKDSDPVRFARNGALLVEHMARYRDGFDKWMSETEFDFGYRERKNEPRFNGLLPFVKLYILVRESYGT